MVCEYILKRDKDAKHTPTPCVISSKAFLAYHGITVITTEGCGAMVPPPIVHGKIHEGLRHETPQSIYMGLMQIRLHRLVSLLFLINIIISYQKSTTNQVLLFLLLSKCRWFFFVPAQGSMIYSSCRGYLEVETNMSHSLGLTFLSCLPTV